MSVMVTYLNHYLAVILIHLINRAGNVEYVENSLLDPKLQVKIAGGKVQGAQDKTDTNLTYYKFVGIPYAAAPLGPLRWKPPVPYGEWTGILNATVERPICVQMSTDLGIEDCLFINVYTPQNVSRQYNKTSLLPVMVWIYGGRFINGYSNYSVYGPDYLLEHGVVFVSFNYRIGILGFLSTEDKLCPGNFGLKDQVEALRWVNTNIDKFGGDPRSVTIFGDSAGAACVSYLQLIPQAKGLFHKAILESGSALCPWAFQKEPRKVAVMLARSLGIFESNTTALMDRLRKTEVAKLYARTLAINLNNAIEPLNGLPFAPSTEPEHEGAVLTGRINELFATGHFNTVPFMIGFTSQEASIVQDVIEISRPYIAHWDLMPLLIVPANLNCTSKGKRREVAMKIKNYYFGKKYISMSTKTEMMNFVGDSQFVRSIRHNVQICAPYTNIYLYVFSYEGYLGRYGTKKERSRKVKGAGHVEDLFYLFRKKNLTSFNATDAQMIAIMTKLWTTFAKYGNPTPPTMNDTMYWPVININDTSLNYLDIDAKLTVKKNPRADAMDFWDDLYKDYKRTEYDTY